MGDGGTPLLQLTDCTEVTEGFSGGPVLDERTGLVIGMVSSVARPDRLDRGQATAYVTPTEALRDVCAELTVSQVCPYQGLEPFTTADAVWFHGRDRAVHAVLASLRRERRFLALLGPSGAGKSSLIHAGVLPALAGGALPGSDRWGWLSIRPGADPFAQLDQAGLAGAADGLGAAARRWRDDHPEYERLVLVVDQFEELLVATPWDLRTALFEQLTLVTEQEPAVTVIVGPRDDFYGRLAAAPELMRLVEQATVNVPAVLDADELAAIIHQPATAVGLTLEPSLAERIASDAMLAAPPTHSSDGSAAITVLPLLEFALTELWHRRKDGPVDPSRLRTDRRGGRRPGTLVRRGLSAQLATSRSLAAQAEQLAASQSDLAQLLSLASLHTAPTSEAWASIQSMLSRPMHPFQQLTGHTDVVIWRGVQPRRHAAGHHQHRWHRPVVGYTCDVG